MVSAGCFGKIRGQFLAIRLWRDISRARSALDRITAIEPIRDHPRNILALSKRWSQTHSCFKVRQKRPMIPFCSRVRRDVLLGDAVAPTLTPELYTAVFQRETASHIRRALYMPALVAAQRNAHVRTLHAQVVARGKTASRLHRRSAEAAASHLQHARDPQPFAGGDFIPRPLDGPENSFEIGDRPRAN